MAKKDYIVKSAINRFVITKSYNLNEKVYTFTCIDPLLQIQNKIMYLDVVYNIYKSGKRVCDYRRCVINNATEESSVCPIFQECLDKFFKILKTIKNPMPE